jgi:hypothetical protein
VIYARIARIALGTRSSGGLACSRNSNVAGRRYPTSHGLAKPPVAGSNPAGRAEKTRLSYDPPHLPVGHNRSQKVGPAPSGSTILSQCGAPMRPRGAARALEQLAQRESPRQTRTREGEKRFPDATLSPEASSLVSRSGGPSKKPPRPLACENMSIPCDRDHGRIVLRDNPSCRATSRMGTPSVNTL